ncbi:Ig domain-containing protein [Actinophytocola sp.]|uniref:Ig domain-containing protein n=1 Tax=Actinophytocola sp. TaxID=1872138 RepID=UPI002D7E911C|nr:Ig domain-containing protein [Actinophytocola sp.]HET9141147.1 Ig domain-containing protein [Actinophytocola sp.]
MTTNRLRWSRRLVWLAMLVAAFSLSTNTALASAGVNAVVVGNPGTQNYVEFDAVSLQMTVGGGTFPYTWTASGLPTSLHINASSGLISGWARAGVYNVTVTATDALGVSGSTTFVIRTPRECRTC